MDVHSKWPKVIQMPSTNSFKTIEALRSLFAKYSLPEQLVSDNRSQFTSEEFAYFMKGNGIKHICSAPHPLLQTGWRKGLFKLSREPWILVLKMNQTLKLNCHSSCLHINQHLILLLTSHLENYFCNGSFILVLIYWNLTLNLLWPQNRATRKLIMINMSSSDTF